MADKEHNNLPLVVAIGYKDHPAIAAVVKLMLEMDGVGKGRMLERATIIVEQHPKAKPCEVISMTDWCMQH